MNAIVYISPYHIHNRLLSNMITYFGAVLFVLLMKQNKQYYIDHKDAY